MGLFEFPCVVCGDKIDFDKEKLDDITFYDDDYLCHEKCKYAYDYCRKRENEKNEANHKSICLQSDVFAILREYARGTGNDREILNKLLQRCELNHREEDIDDFIGRQSFEHAVLYAVQEVVRVNSVNPEVYARSAAAQELIERYKALKAWEDKFFKEKGEVDE